VRVDGMKCELMIIFNGVLDEKIDKGQRLKNN
jgi:hypothetical protein